MQALIERKPCRTAMTGQHLALLNGGIEAEPERGVPTHSMSIAPPTDINRCDRTGVEPAVAMTAIWASTHRLIHRLDASEFDDTRWGAGGTLR
jgi:hypothetical protein